MKLGCGFGIRGTADVEEAIGRRIAKLPNALHKLESERVHQTGLPCFSMARTHIVPDDLRIRQ